MTRLRYDWRRGRRHKMVHRLRAADAGLNCGGGYRSGTWWWSATAATPSETSCSTARVCPSPLSSSPNCAKTRPCTSQRQPRRPGQIGRPRVVGARLPSPTAVLDDPAHPMDPLPLPLSDGASHDRADLGRRAVVPRRLPVGPPAQRVVIRHLEEPLGPHALLCTDIEADPLQIVQWYMLRWQVEVTFEELRAHLGMETQRQWSERAIAGTTPALFGLFSVVTLAADVLNEQQGGICPRSTAVMPKPTLLSPTPLVWSDDTSGHSRKIFRPLSWALN